MASDFFKTEKGITVPLKYEAPVLTNEEQIDLGNFYRKLYDMYWYSTSNQFLEFNNLTYRERGEENRKLAVGFSAYKDDERDVSITTGTASKKKNSIVQFVKQYNFIAQIRARDQKNIVIDQMGRIAEQLVEITRKMELWEEKKEGYISELVEQGTVFAEEFYNEYSFLLKDTGSWKYTDDPSKFKPDDKPVYKYSKKCETKIHLGEYVFLGNYNEKDIQKQPIIAIYEELPRSEFETMYGKYWRVKNNNIPYNVYSGTPLTLFAGTGEKSGAQYFNWNFFSNLSLYRVGIIKIMEKQSNRIQILANGTPILPVNYPLTAFYKDGNYPIAKGIINSRANFTYGISELQLSTVDQYVADEILRGILNKQKQSNSPTMGTRTDKVLGKDMYNSKQTIRGLRQDDIFPALPAETRIVTEADLKVFNLADSLANKKIVSDDFEGGASGTQTATQNINNTNRSVLSVQSVIDGWANFEEQLIKLRLANILQNVTKFKELDQYQEAIDFINGSLEVFDDKTSKKKKRKIYQSFMDQSILANGKQGLSLIKFSDSSPSTEDIEKEAISASEQYGKPVNISYVDVSILEKIDLLFDVTVTPSPNRDTQAELITTIQNYNNIIGLLNTIKQTGNLLNVDSIKQELAFKLGKNYNELFGTSEPASGDANDALMQELQKKGFNPPTEEGAPSPQQQVTAPNQDNIVKGQLQDVGQQLPNSAIPLPGQNPLNGSQNPANAQLGLR